MRLTVVVAVCALVAVCGCSSSGDGSASTTLLPPPGADQIVECTGTPFPFAALDGPTGVERSDDPASQGLAAHLSTAAASVEMGGGLTGWRKLAEDDGMAVFAAGEPPDMTVVELEADGDGDGWEFAGSTSGCVPRPVLADGIGWATWTLDPDFPPPSANDTEVHVLLSGRACSSGEPVGDRRIGPEIRETDGLVVIAFAEELPDEDGRMHTCEGTLGEPVTVELPSPLGDRTLADGSTVPPTPVKPRT